MSRYDRDVIFLIMMCNLKEILKKEIISYDICFCDIVEFFDNEEIYIEIEVKEDINSYRFYSYIKYKFT